MVASGLAVISYGIFKFGAEREVRILTMIRTNRVQWRHQPPIHPIPSQLVRKDGCSRNSGLASSVKAN